MTKTSKLVAAMGIPAPTTLEDAVRERDAWIETAAHFSDGQVHYRKQRDAFLRAAVTDPAVRKVAAEVVGDGWWRLLDLDEEPG